MTDLTTSTQDASPVSMSPGRVALRRAMRHGGFWVGGTIIFVIVLMAIFAPLLTPYDPSVQSLSEGFVPPVWAETGSWEHPLGTDNLGRDYFARLLYGARISLGLGLLTVIISGTIGTAMGITAGYWGGWPDMFINFFITVRLTLPVVLVALVVVALIGSSLWLLILVIGLLLWDRFAIVVRSATQQLAQREYITSARAIGSSTPRILFREILPNITGPLVVVTSIEIAHAILLEAALSFLGLGVQPPDVSWGLMVAEAKAQLLFRPWMIAIPGAALVFLIFAINLVGDALRDVTTPEGKA